MDDRQFDRIARAAARGASRRQVLAALASATVASRLGAGRPAAAQATCAPGQTNCGGACVDLATDLAHCGACDAPCASKLVAVACRDGQCVRADCAVGQEYCGAVDGCRDLTSDPLHCGACGNACPAGQDCVDGACATGSGTGPTQTACAEGQLVCGGVCVDGCCNNDHCGACGNACTGVLTCFEGQCDCPSGNCCAEGETLCGDTCVATCCGNANCGACGNACGAGLTCFEGVCDCPSGNCPGTPAPGGGQAGEATPVAVGGTTLPNVGSGAAAGGGSGWPLLAAGSAAAALLARLTRTAE